MVLLLLLSASSAGAHQLRIAKTDFVQVFNPEVSQAFYGEPQGNCKSSFPDLPSEVRLPTPGCRVRRMMQIFQEMRYV
jgi:hypothetical protein